LNHGAREKGKGVEAPAAGEVVIEDQIRELMIDAEAPARDSRREAAERLIENVHAVLI
jgi:hypothetical protein